MVTVGEALIRAAAELTGRIAEPVRLDAELLLAHVLDVDRVWFQIHDRDPLTTAHLEEFAALVTRRAGGEPIGYLFGSSEFYSLTIEVTPDVLIPRPETEMLVDLAQALLRNRLRSRVLDLCTGSGCIAVAIAAQLPTVMVVATDISPEALAVAERNVKRLDLSDRIELRRGDLFQQAPERFDLIVSNPPYVAKNDPALTRDVAEFEPRLALIDVLDGDGLGFYRQIASRARAHLASGGTILLEVGETQAQRVGEMFEHEGLVVETHRDLAGIERVVAARS